MLNPHIFRAYDVRGQGRHRHQPRRLPPGRPRLRHAHPAQRRPHGRRRHGQPPVVADAQGGVRRRACAPPGVDVVDIGVNHTPLLYFATAHWKLDGGATITGSHNPVDVQRREDGARGRGAAHRGRDPGAARRRSSAATSSAGRGGRQRREPARRLLRRRSPASSSSRGRSRSWSTRATASRASSRPSCCAASAAR